MNALDVVPLPADRLPGAALLVPLFEDQRPLAGPAAVVDWRLDGALTRLIRDAAVSGRSGECIALQGNARFAAPWIVLIGGGRWQALDRERYRALLGRVFKVVARAGWNEIALCLPAIGQVPAVELETLVRAALAEAGKVRHCRLSWVEGLH